MCMQVSALIQKFAEGRSERTTPVQAVRRSLNLVTADCHAKYARYDVGLSCALCWYTGHCFVNCVVCCIHCRYADALPCFTLMCPGRCSVSVLSENQDSALLVAAVGVQDSVHENNRLQKFPGSNSAVEHFVKSGADYLTWSSSSGASAPSDWSHLSASAGEGLFCTSVVLYQLVALGSDTDGA